MRELIYVSELVFPSKSAYSIQVMKMCDAFSQNGFKVSLFVLDCKISKKKLYSDYSCKKKFNIKSFNLGKNNFYSRIIYSIKILFFLKKNKKNYFIFSRSIISALLLNLYFNKIILEIHHSLKGFTFCLFSFFKFFKLIKNIKFLFITYNLKKLFNLKNKNLVLGDAVAFKDFSRYRSIKKYNKTCVYAGSFSKGKGLETIVKLSSLLPNIKFHLYGDLENSVYAKKELNKYSNVIYKGYLRYCKIPYILNLYKAYLMPYSNRVYVRSKNIEVSNYMSPLKLFEYMASEGVIFASNMKVYSHILNNKNSVIIKNNSLKEWKQQILTFFKNTQKFNFLSLNAKNRIKNNTWENRVKRIENLYKR